MSEYMSNTMDPACKIPRDGGRCETCGASGGDNCGRRVTKCLTALAGIDDPAAFVRDVRAAIKTIAEMSSSETEDAPSIAREVLAHFGEDT